MALRNLPYFPLYVQDYLSDEKLSLCSYATQGIYVRIMCTFHKNEPYGGVLFESLFKQNLSMSDFFVEVLHKKTGVPIDEMRSAIDELLFYKVLQIGKKSGVAFLYQPRMIRDNEISVKRSKSAKKGGGNPALKGVKKRTVDPLEEPLTNTQNLFKQKDKQNTEYEYEYNINNKLDKINTNTSYSSTPEKKKKKPEKNQNQDELEFPFESETFKNAWAEWLEYKKENFNFRYKHNVSHQKALNELYNLAGGNEKVAIAIIDQSMANSWKGFFGLKTPQASQFGKPNQPYKPTGIGMQPSGELSEWEKKKVKELEEGMEGIDLSQYLTD